MAEGAPTYSDADKARARQWFKKATDSRERREYDYALESMIVGLGFWPEAVEEGHMPLRSIAIQRHQAGGKKPGMLETTVKRPTTGKDHKQAMLNAEYLLTKDPGNAGYMDALLRNAVKGGFLETATWVSGLILDSLRKEKLQKARFKSFRQDLVEGAQKAEAAGNPAQVVALLEAAVQSLDFQLARQPDEELRQEQRDLSGRLTITRGKYAEAETFRDSLRDAEKQKLLHDADRVKQGEETFEAIVAAARREYEAEPTNATKINAYVDALLRAERKKEESEATRVLLTAFEASRNYAFKVRADDVQLRQLGRTTRETLERARQTGAEEDEQQARLAAMEQRQVTLDVYRERAAKYPTDLRLKLRLGAALFESGEYDEAIPTLQAAQADPRGRARSQLLIGQCFYEKATYSEAAAVLQDALSKYELQDDLGKDLLYWLARSHEAAGDKEEARAAFGRLLRLDYNYADGDARKRMDSLK